MKIEIEYDYLCNYINMYTHIEMNMLKVNYGLPLPSAYQFLHGVIGTENNWTYKEMSAKNSI